MGQQVKNLLRAQSKYGLMGFSAKTGKKIVYGSQEQFFDKTLIWDRTPPTYISTAVYMCGEGSRVPNLQTEFNYLDLFKSYGIFSDFVVPVIPASSPSSPSSLHHPRHHHVIPASSPSSLCCPHSPQKVSMLSPSSPSSLLSLLSPPMLSPSSPSSPHCPHHPRII